uniref:WD_REPEATS_REGION domain-containing protein n=2 Tax=Mesocestoides corti TaxID=53468 RepID=A0A5K3F513_MESCO
MSASDRKAELARKKARLAALRDERLKKEELQHNFAPQTAGVFDSNSISESVSIDGILKELGVADNVATNGKIDDEERLRSASATTFPPNLLGVEKPPPKLGVSKVAQCCVNPRELITYSKQVQTEQDVLLEVQSPTIDRWDDDASRSHLGLQSFDWDDEIGAIPYDDQESVLPDVTQLIKNLELNKSVRFLHSETPSKQIPPRELSEEEKQVAMESEEFQDFFLRTSRIIERALDDTNDIFFDYSGADREDTQGKDELVKYIGDFYDNSFVCDASVVALDWSAVHPELLLVAYQSREGGGVIDNGAGDGLVSEGGSCLVWNLKYRQTAPEHIFTYQVDITAAILTEFHPNLVIGGTRGGQIVIWDSRANRRTPSQKTRLAGGSAHVEAICGLAVTGSRNANSLVSVSSDGRLCSWSFDMLGSPQQSLELASASKRTANPITPTCLAFLPGEANRFLVGAQDGNVYAGSRHDKTAGISDQFESHKAPVTCLAMMPSLEAPLGLEEPPSTLFVTTAMDCSVKLWSHREPAYPLLSYDDRNEYFVGCDYSPIHPALFATTDLGGSVDLWSLNSDHEVPTASTQVGGDALLNRCRFHKKGFHLAVGGDDGRVRLFELHENLAMPKADEWVQLNRLVRNLSNSASEQREFDVQNQSRHFQGHHNHAR